MRNKRDGFVNRFIFRIICIIVGLIFIFSGAVKAIDPLGTVYKIEDYLVAMHLGFLSPLSFIASFVLIVAEFLAGALLVLNVRFKLGLWLTTLFMIAMTPLTLWIALYNPVTDCGCFGDALKISNWATFWKNIVISLLLVYLWICRAVRREWLVKKIEWCVAAIMFLIPLVVGVMAINDLPLIDFRPYKIGANLYESMQLPEGAEPDRYDVTFVYSKDGVDKEFSLQDAPINDSTWVFVDQRTELIKKGDEPEIHDFVILTPDGNDLTDLILLDEGRTYFFVMYDLEKTNTKVLNNLDIIYRQATTEGSRVIALTSSYDMIDDFKIEHNIEYDFALTDPIQLKTMVRSNPGVVVLENGVVVDKYNPK